MKLYKESFKVKEFPGFEADFHTLHCECEGTRQAREHVRRGKGVLSAAKNIFQEKTMGLSKMLFLFLGGKEKVWQLVMNSNVGLCGPITSVAL